jgi:parallel beta-helix repeat protein
MSILTNVFHVQLNIANPEIIIVSNTYLSIQEAINHARPGETIYVKAGVYLEHIVIGKNNLKIVGENKYTTIIDGQGTGTVVYVKANSTVFDGFTIKNSGYNFTDSGIYIDHSLKAYISDNNVIDSNLGIYLYASSNIVLRNNNMTTNRYNFGVSGDNLQDYIHDIDASNMVDGKPLIYWVNQTNRQPPVNAGYIAIVNSTKITLQDLTLSRNWQAVLFAYSTNSNIKNVTATRNMDCIWLLNCSACSVMDSTISDNSWGGIALVDSSACSVYGNNINNNVEYGIFLSDSSDNLFYHNNFINNTSQVWLFGFNSNNWDDGYSRGGNFWSNYKCTDEKSGLGQKQTGNDGICDIPFIIDSNNTDRYPLMKPWSLQSPKVLLVSLIPFVITGLIILITCCIILYLIRIRKKSFSIQSLRIHKCARNYFPLFLFQKKDKDVVE